MSRYAFQVSAGLWDRIKFLFVGRMWIALTQEYIVAISSLDDGSGNPPGAN